MAGSIAVRGAMSDEAARLAPRTIQSEKTATVLYLRQSAAVFFHSSSELIGGDSAGW